MPVAPRPAGSGPLFERARKRVTQRLSLAGLNSAAPGTGKIKIPAAPAPEPVAPPVAPVEAVVEVPASVLLPHIPEAVLLGSAADLAAGPQGQSFFRLPLGTILPMLPSGKIEVTVGDLATWGPEGVMHPLEVLGEWASQMASLPLPQIVMRIPPEMMVLRRDQKQIDTMVLSMDDPFSPEALKAKAEAARAAAEAAAAAANAEPEPVSAPQPLPPEPEVVLPQPEPQAEAEPEPEPEPTPPAVVEVDEPVPELPQFSPELAATTYIPEGTITAPADEEAVPSAEPAGSDAPAPDFSFTQSPEYLALLAKLNQSEESPAAENPGKTEPEQAAEISEPEVRLPEVIPPKPSFQFAKPAPAPEPAPPVEAMRSPLEAAVEATSPGLGSSFAKALGEITKKGEAGPVPSAPKPRLEAAPDSSAAGGMRGLLKLAADAPAEIKDVVHQIGLWPGVDACLICGLDGLPIASFAPPGRVVPQVAAVAPKLLKTLTTLFTDLGRAEPEELAVPAGEETLHFFRHHEMILILSCREASIPPVYRRTIRDVLALLSAPTAKS